jgi:hypothetical protein
MSDGDLKAALASGMVEPDGVDAEGRTIYRLTRAGEILTGRGALPVGRTAQNIQQAHPVYFGRQPIGLA